MNWEHLLSVAQAEVQGTTGELPDDLREAAQHLPVIFERKPSTELLADGAEADTLGFFIGAERDEEESGQPVLPPHIILYLENLWDFAEQNEEIFIEEVYITYIHELGHYLGLNEEDLGERGLL